ncbi:hypothetical protein BDN72DRAFT_865315, partial [Pluteus cervinus]
TKSGGSKVSEGGWEWLGTWKREQLKTKLTESEQASGECSHNKVKRLGAVGDYEEERGLKWCSLRANKRTASVAVYPNRFRDRENPQRRALRVLERNGGAGGCYTSWGGGCWKRYSPRANNDLENPQRRTLEVLERDGESGAWLGTWGGEWFKAKLTEGVQMSGESCCVSHSVQQPRKPPEARSRGSKTSWRGWGIVRDMGRGGAQTEAH